MAIVETADVATRLGRTLTGAEEAAVPGVVEAIVGEVELHLKRDIGENEWVESIDANHGRVIRLQHSPVRSTVIVTDLDGTTLTTGTDYVPMRSGALGLLPLGYRPVLPYTVTYTAGYKDTDPEWRVLKGAILDWTCEALTRTTSDGNVAADSVGYEGTSVTYLPKLDRVAVLGRLGRLQRIVIR